MAGKYDDLLGTLRQTFKLGIGGGQLKNNSGQIQARNSADNAFTAFAALLFQTYGNDFELNSGATSSGDSWKFTIRRPSTGQTEDLTLVMPVGAPSPGQAITVTSFASGVITLGYTTIAAGNDKVVVDTTTLAFGSSSPLTMFNLPANAVVREVKVIVDTAFNGTPSLSVGITGTTSKYLGSTQVDLTAPAGTIFTVDPGQAPVGSVEALIATYAAGGASAGSARIEVAYVIPS